MNIEESLSFDDVLLVPQYSDVETRSLVSTKVKIKEFTFAQPIIPANMKTITGKNMAEFLLAEKSLGLLHRFMSIEEQIQILQDLEKVNGKNTYNYIGVSVGVREEDKKNIKKFLDIGVKIFCIDIAHGDSKQCVEMCKYIKSLGNVLLIAGNVCTKDGALRLWNAGADVCKVGVGNGSLCSTRIETGNGFPQLSALINISSVKPNNKYIISDGGIKNAGDVVKALCFSNMIMSGSLFAGTEEAPGETIKVNDQLYKQYAGSSTHKTNHIEGVIASVPYKGRAKDILTKLLEGVKSGCSYQGVSSIDDLNKNKPHMVRITNAGWRESVPHNPHVIKSER